MPNLYKANVHIDSDWATFQLMTQDTRIEPLMGHKYPEGTVFTENGFVFGQPNEQLQPQRVQIPFGISAYAPTITFFTAKGDNGTGGDRGGIIVVQLAGRDYVNTSVTGDGLNVQGFFNAPVRN